MNLKNNILDYLENKKNWDILTKIIYIYIMVCKTFSYDFRYIYGNLELQKKIYQKRLNITKIEEYEVVCSTLAFIMQDLLREIGITTEISYDVLPHVFLIIELPPYKIKLDAMKLGYDLTRAKVENNIYGVVDLNNTEGFSSKVVEATQKIYGNGLISTSESLKRLHIELVKMKMFRNTPEITSYFDDNALEYKMKLIKDFINHTGKVKRFDDCDRYFDYLNGKFMTEWEKSKIHKHPFWKEENGNWSILNLILLEYQNRAPICFKMSQKEGKYYINSIEKSEMLDYLDNYEGKIKGLYRGLMM